MTRVEVAGDGRVALARPDRAVAVLGARARRVSRRVGRGLVACGLLAAATAAAAEDARVTADLTPAAGDASRLELAYWPEGGWRVRQDGRRVEIAFPGAAVRIAAGALADPAFRNRIDSAESGADASASYLRLLLGCDCMVAVQGDGRRLFIDILGAAPGAGSDRRSGGAPAPRAAPEPPKRAATLAAAAADHSGPIEETRTRLLAELRRAADAGVVELRGDAAGEAAVAAPDDPSRTEGGASADARPSPAPAQAAEVTAAAAPWRAAAAAMQDEPVTGDGRPPAHGDGRSEPPGATSADDGAARAALAKAIGAPARHCLDDRDFLLPDPLPPARFTAELGRLRRALIGEFDRAVEQSALDLARLYLAHGLGLEAERMVSEFAPTAREAPLIVALGRLAEGVALPEPGLLAVPGCRGQHGLWQAMSAALSGRPGEAAGPAIEALGATEQMARGLRGAVAVRLGLVAVAAGRLEFAERMRAMARRSARPGDRETSEGLTLLDVRLSRARGDLEDERAQLERLRHARGPAGREALIRLAELGRDRSPGDPLRLDLGAAALAGRGTPEGERAFLAEAELSGWIIGRDAAFELLRHGREAGEVGETAYVAALARLERDLPVRPSELPLAVRFDADPAQFEPSLADRDFRLALAHSYLRLDAPRLAEAVLRPGDAVAGGPGDGGIVAELAEAYLRTGDDADAARLSATLGPGPSRARTEAGLAARRGEPAAALAGLLSLAAEPEEIARAAWAAGDWPQAAAVLAEASAGAGGGPAADTPPYVPGAGAPAAADTAAAASAPAGGGSAEGAAETAAKAAASAVDLQTALRLAVAAIRAGEAAPPEAAARLAASLPGGNETARALLAAPTDLPAAPSPEAVGTFLAPIAAEARIIAELLNDG